MSPVETGGPAFPTDDQERQGGMSIRDYFAGQALIMFGANLQAVSAVATQDGVNKTTALAGASYEVADAMLKIRANGDK